AIATPRTRRKIPLPSRPPPGESCRSAITASGVLRGATIAGSVAAATSRYLKGTGKPSGASRSTTAGPGQRSRHTPRPCPPPRHVHHLGRERIGLCLQQRVLYLAEPEPARTLRSREVRP